MVDHLNQGDVQHCRNADPEEAGLERGPDPTDDDGLEGRVLHHLLASHVQFFPLFKNGPSHTIYDFSICVIDIGMRKGRN